MLLLSQMGEIYIISTSKHASYLLSVKMNKVRKMGNGKNAIKTKHETRSIDPFFGWGGGGGGGKSPRAPRAQSRNKIFAREARRKIFRHLRALRKTSCIQQYFNTSITVLTYRVWKLLIALFKVPNTGALTVHVFSMLNLVVS